MPRLLATKEASLNVLGNLDQGIPFLHSEMFDFSALIGCNLPQQWLRAACDESGHLSVTDDIKTGSPLR
jgi:hypothetical protein